MPTTSDIFSKYISPVFVETGSHMGEGVNNALTAGFSHIYSIELSDKYYAICKDRFKEKKNVSIIKGDSGLVLFEVIKDINSNITFWLNGHYSGGDTAQGIANSPIIFELEAIKKHSIKSHTILIDDMRGFDAEELKIKLLEINSDYKFYYEDGFCPNDILVAKV